VNTGVAKSLVAIAALGAALIHLALVISAPVPLAVILVILGVTEFGWGMLTLSLGRMLAPQIVRVVALAPVLLWSLIVVIADVLQAPEVASYFSVVPMAVATLFELFSAIVITRQLRNEKQAPGPASSRRAFVGLVVGALVIATLTAPALAYAQAGGTSPHARQSFSTTDHPGH
jgi:hypothetical protein